MVNSPRERVFGFSQRRVSLSPASASAFRPVSMKMRRSSSSKRSAGVFFSSPTQFCAAACAHSDAKSNAISSFMALSLKGFLDVDIEAGVVAPARDVDAQIDASLLGREPAQAEAHARQVGLLAHAAERARHLSGAGECDGAEA